MNIKSLLLGSAAALAAVSGAQAADAIVAAAPEPLEYVRVCDAFGKGYFYIPGTETCLKISGYVRFQADWASYQRGAGRDDFDWNTRTRGLVSFSAKSDTELGALGSTITLRTWAESDSAAASVELDEAFLTLGGFRAGYGYNYWDAGLSGETDNLGSNRINQIGYEYTAGSIKAGLFVDELTKAYSRTATAFNTGTYGAGGGSDFVNDNVGIEGQVSGVFGPVNVALLGGYDFAASEGAARLLATVAIGPGTLGAAVVYSSGVNAYYDVAEWTAAVEYAVKVTDKLTLTPGFQYFWNVNANNAGDYGSGEAWKAGLTLDYVITSGLTAKISAQYSDTNGSGTAGGTYASGGSNDNAWSGFFRLQRTF